MSNDKKLSFNLSENEKNIRKIFDKCFDFVVREINITNNPKYPCRIMYLANMCDKIIIEEDIMKKLTDDRYERNINPGELEYILGLLGIGKDDVFEDIDKAVEGIIEGNAIVLVNGIDKVILTGVKEPPGRAVSEPGSEKVVRGPREGFIEILAVNIALLRRKIKNPNLKTELLKVGKQTRTDIAISYISNIVDEKIVEEVKRRIGKIEIDSVLESNYIKEYIQDKRFNLTPPIFRTEKPDVVAAKLLEGRVAIFTDGTPVVMTVPTIFSEFLMTDEDYYENFILVSMIRILRYVAFFMSMVLPGIYVSLITFHSELLPSQLAITIVRSRANAPFSAVVEALLMTMTFTILQEADIRLPKSMGQAVSIVGALVLGEAAVSAGLVGSPMVIITALSGISGLAIPIPEMQLCLTYLRLIFLMASSVLGLFGITCGLMILFMYLISQRSFGVPYMMPIAPLSLDGLGDSIIRIPLWKMKTIPELFIWKRTARRKGREDLSSETKGDELKKDDNKEE